MIKISNNFPFNPKKFPFFYGIVIAIAAIVGTLFTAPGQTIGVSVFTDYLIDSLKLSRLELSTAYAVGTILSSLVIGKVGRHLDIKGTRIIATMATFFLGLSLFYMSRVDKFADFINSIFPNIPHFFPAFIAVTSGFFLIRFLGQGTLMLSCRTMLMKWFLNLRGRVNSIVGLFVSVLFAASPRVFEFLIETFTWRGAWIIMGLMLILPVSIFIFTFFRNTPEECGLKPDGNFIINKANDESKTEINWTLKEARKTLTFRTINLSLAMFSLIFTAISFHIISIFETVGYTRKEAISIFIPASIISMAINLIAGFLSDTSKLKYQLKFFLMFFILGLAMSTFGVIQITESYGKYLIIIGNGLASGLFGSVGSISFPRYFGRKHLGEIGGLNMSYMVFFSAIGPALFGLSHKYFGDYSIASGIILGILLVIFIFSFKADRPLKTINSL